MGKSKKLLSGLMFILIVALGLAACSSESSRETKSDSKTEEKVETVKVGMLKSLSNSSIYIGDEKGIFEKYGIDIEYVPFQAAQPIAVAAQTGDIDVGSTALTAGFFNLLGKNSEVRLVADSGREKENYKLTALVVSNDAFKSGVKSIKDLKGKKIGITQTGSSHHFMAGQLLESAGLTIDDVELVPLGGISNVAAALESNQVDAGLLLSTVGTPLLEKGSAHLITWIGDVVEMQTTSIFYSAQMIENKDVAERFLKAYVESVRYYHDNVLNAADKNSEEFKSAVTVLSEQTGISEQLVADNLPYVDRDATVWKENIGTWINWFDDNGLLTDELDVNNVIAEELHAKVLKELE
ncbi:ABC transporter substrate-binding protein [Bacillus sp. AGMB 02131]|uniref:ABC transporter substrate-binding protein n=1 Tax=Peribacillus faecalis TaxID=2772559 RepID=A0A927HAL0_9BACI|nr:ABC transporter substrate-binding protein [Peribacillus faecalis]MBD3108039.1 ABC transporter substrate-binding protein [Peribacillus faecalis]